MKQKVLKKLGLLALSSIMVVPNVLGGKILENNSKPIGNEKAYPKLSTKDAGKNPKKESTVKAKSGSGFFGKLFKLVGGVVVLNETHNLIRTLIGNPYFCLGMAEKLYNKEPYASLSKATLYSYALSGNLLYYFQRKPGTDTLENDVDMYNTTNQTPSNTKTYPVFQGVLTPLTDDQLDAEYERGQKFANNHPYLALFILKRFDAMFALGIDTFRGVATFDEASTNPTERQESENSDLIFYDN